MFLVAILIKLGAAPFHAWVPRIVESLSWIVLFILLTVQKLNPLFILFTWDFFSFFRIKIVFLAILSSLVLGSFLGLIQVRVRMLLIFSSINHIGWILSAFIFGLKLTFFYFFVYILLLRAIVFPLSKFNLQHVNQLASHSLGVVWAPFLFFNLLSLGGLPPFLGFLPKWLVLQQIINGNFFFLSLVIILCSLLVLYFYLRLTFSAFILKKLTWVKTDLKVRFHRGLVFFNLLSLGGLCLSFLV